jgi:hypothetical protein
MVKFIMMSVGIVRIRLYLIIRPDKIQRLDFSFEHHQQVNNK